MIAKISKLIYLFEVSLSMFMVLLFSALQSYSFTLNNSMIESVIMVMTQLEHQKGQFTGI